MPEEVKPPADYPDEPSVHPTTAKVRRWGRIGFAAAIVGILLVALLVASLTGAA